MKTTNDTFQPLNSVSTILSQETINCVEVLLHWFYEHFDEGEGFIEPLMDMLEAYIDNNNSDRFKSRKIAMTSEMLQLNARLWDIADIEKPWEWQDVTAGWRRPIDKN